MVNATDKLLKLLALLQELESVVIGFSGGVDSSFLCAAAQRVMGNKAVAVTACSATLPAKERIDAGIIAGQIGIRHVLLPISELDSPDFVANTPDRCYFCKQQRFTTLGNWARREGFQWVLEGSNADDVSDYRPGMRAIAELNMVRSPLLEVGLSKLEIRELSRVWNLPTWNKPSAACLSSRIAYGQTVTAEKLGHVEAAEEFLQQYCSGQIRVRHHGNLARIEVSQNDMARLTQPMIADEIIKKLKGLGFVYVTLDLAGYRMGSMNDALLDNSKILEE